MTTRISRRKEGIEITETSKFAFKLDESEFIQCDGNSSNRPGDTMEKIFSRLKKEVKYCWKENIGKDKQTFYLSVSLSVQFQLNVPFPLFSSQVVPISHGTRRLNLYKQVGPAQQEVSQTVMREQLAPAPQEPRAPAIRQHNFPSGEVCRKLRWHGA